MSYYEEGQAGFGGLGLAFPALNLNTSAPAPTARTNVGIDPAIIAALGTYLTALGGSFGSSDTNRTPMITSGVLLKALKPNSFGKIDPAAVTQALNIMSPALQAYAANALSMNASLLAGAPYADAAAALRQLGVLSITGLLSDIAAGKYDGTLPTVSVKLNALAALKTQAATSALVTAQTQQAVANQAAQQAAATQAASDAAAAQQAQANADAAAAAAQAAQDAANAAMATAQTGDPGVGPSDLVGSTTQAMPVTSSAASGSYMTWVYVGVGAAALAAVGWVLMSRKSTPNRSRKSRKNRRHSKRVRRAARKA